MTGVQTDVPLTRRARRSQPAKHLRTDIQGLRALAVGMVVLAHAGIPFAAGGFIGVDVFFVISGFLITSLLLREVQRSSTISIRGFYERRARRILPAGTVVLVVTMLYAAFTFSADRVGSIAGDAIWSSVFLANVHYAIDGTDYFAAGDPSPLQHFWSLAVEEQFYLLWPLLVLAIVVVVRRRSKHVPFTRLVAVAVTAIIIGSLAWSMIETAVSPSTAYFSTPARAYELAGGALVAALTAAGTQVPGWLSGPRRALLGWAGFAGLIVMMAAWDERTQIPGILAGLVVLATAGMLVSGIGDVRGAGRMLSVRPVRFIGDISYSLYLWHWPLLTLGLLPGWGHAPRAIVLIAASVVLAALSYRFVELPFQRGRVRMPRRTGHLILWPVAAVTVIAVSVGATWQTQQQLQQAQAAAASWYEQHPATASPSPEAAEDAPDPLETVHAQLSQALADADAGAPAPPSLDLAAQKDDVFQNPYPCVAWWGSTSTKICPQGDESAVRTVVLVGDSHAGQWIAALDRLGAEQGFRLVPLIKPACNVYDVEQYFAQMPKETCHAFKKWARDEVAELKPDAVVVAARGYDGVHASGAERERIWRAGAESGIRALVGLAPAVYVLSDIPARSSSAQDCLTVPGATLESCLATETGREIDSNTLTRDAAQAAGARWVDTSPLVCEGGRCPLVVGSTLTYFDDNHLTVSRARELAPALGELLGWVASE